MQKGYMQLMLPEGEVLTFGDVGHHLHADAHIKSNNFFKRAFLFGDIGFAESYMDGEWETSDLTKLLSWFLLNIDNAPTLSGSKMQSAALNIFRWYNKVFHSKNENSLHGSKKNIAEHYDLSNDFFRLFLDPSMTYSSAYFTKPDLDLEAAQYEKYDSLCTSLKLNPEDHVLEIGTGWGGFAEFAAKNYGCKITTITISKEQHAYAVERIQNAGLSQLVEVRLQDYRHVEGTFDKVVSIEMIEAVGAQYLKTYFDKIQSVLKPSGVLAIQAIICPDARFDTLKKNVDFIQKHIFPGSLLPSIAAINASVNATSDMFLFGLKDLGKSYATTLAEWRDRFNTNIDKIRQMGFDESFIRKWNYYFAYCEAAFDMRNINVVQMVYTRPNNYGF
ncbi:MAG TPA: cyclopropane-fatty-acyl-phospholipid synthase family protein [Chitinophagales bacterium]|nr:cyclopropane-fatty-acyl-phospholipid synthase family protein [Chitinophagales bacterium]HNJ90084.1 cyclopropane-fatty-acyl-phospholipid synthase family protein [Chitinophagales bacterium]HNM09589.1 cyclopropane-fatty-acyl-phospholipid synthase family protein [Chitinophagales bacterium]HNM30290.1 cyclopropane-fatty-acyl-phospholipid synthase family protein [Chitinophagales bacterium]